MNSPLLTACAALALSCLVAAPSYSQDDAAPQDTVAMSTSMAQSYFRVLLRETVHGLAATDPAIAKWARAVGLPDSAAEETIASSLMERHQLALTLTEEEAQALLQGTFPDQANRDACRRVAQELAEQGRDLGSVYALLLDTCEDARGWKLELARRVLEDFLSDKRPG